MTDAPAQAAPSRWRDVDGIVLLDKPEGMTSNAALQRVRRAYGARKAGHTGSLDPLASGLLPVCLGQATKASGLLLDADKTYRVRIALGSRTATGDREGEPIESLPVPAFDDEKLRQVAAGFLGETMQVPPMYSALKHQGERLYRLARRGVEVERPPRRVRIGRLDVIGRTADSIELEVDCSKGTYVRSLAEDLARALGTAGYVQSLRRLALGPFHGNGMTTLEALESAADDPAALDGFLLPPDRALSRFPAVQLDDAGDAAILHGRQVAANGPSGARVRMYGAGGRFLGIGRMSPEGAVLAPERVMVAAPATPVLRA
jgi:tRNA pseudouridine55 synthase